MKRKSNEEIEEILKKDFHNFLLNKQAPHWIKSYSQFDFYLNKKTKKVELTSSIKKVILEDGVTWENSKLGKQLIKIDDNGNKTIHISYDNWEDIQIYKSAIDLKSFEVETLYEYNHIELLNEEDFFV
ncbi:hypothetical protein [uncultured Dokdonia sp.]|uniref:hypothetical protein n=1 Tax=uncultured Dokdonia sp. TaxID=575653 RepID=UPI00261E324D|nr:hypothetical protein [uncultured Dokdonia sp.]